MTEQQKAEAYVRSKLPELKLYCHELKAYKLEPIHLEHWLRVLGSHHLTEITVQGDGNCKARFIPPYVCHRGIRFNLTTGQPATEADYQAFNEIVGNNTP